MHVSFNDPQGAVISFLNIPARSCVYCLGDSSWENYHRKPGPKCCSLAESVGSMGVGDGLYTEAV